MQAIASARSGFSQRVKDTLESNYIVKQNLEHLEYF